MRPHYPSDIIRAITELLFIGAPASELRPADLVIVMGNEYIYGTMDEVNSLYRSGKIKPDARIILSGATGVLNAGKPKECDRLYAAAVDRLAMPPELFIKEGEATNASENFSFSKAIIESLGGFNAFESILCVSKAYMLRRCSMYASRQGYPVEKMQYYGTVDRENFNADRDNWWEDPRVARRLMAELERIGRYYAAGDVDIF